MTRDRVAALVATLLATGCAAEPTHLVASVNIELASDDPAAAVVNASAEAYVWVDEEFQVRDMASGLAAQLELDGAAVALVESEPGVLASEPRTGFPDRIVLAGDGDTGELDHSVLFSARVQREEAYLRVTLDPPVDPVEAVSVLQYSGRPSGPDNRLLAAGADHVDLKPGYSRVVVQRIVTTREDDAGLRIGGTVRVAREVPVPCWVGDPAPCP